MTTRTAVMGYNFIVRGDIYIVLTPKRERYEVDLDEPHCSCMDFQVRGRRHGTCKYIELVRRALAPKTKGENSDGNRIRERRVGKTQSTILG